jgi:predicted nucleic acid-binding protein
LRWLLALVEVGAAIVHPTGDVALARFGVSELRSVPVIVFAPLNAGRAHRAAELAISLRLRGADAVYAQVAEEFDGVLITWDTEMLQRTASTVPAMTPSEWMASQT